MDAGKPRVLTAGNEQFDSRQRLGPPTKRRTPGRSVAPPLLPAAAGAAAAATAPGAGRRRRRRLEDGERRFGVFVGAKHGAGTSWKIMVNHHIMHGKRHIQCYDVL